MKKVGQINIRADIELLAAFTEIAESMGQTPANLGANVIKDFVQIYHYKIQRGDISLSKPILKKIFETVDKKKIDEIVEFTASFIVSEIRSQEGKLTYEILLEHFVKWNKGRIQFNRIKQDDSDMIVSKHLMCQKWSEIQCKTYARCFELIGEVIREMDYSSEDTYWLEVVRHSNNS